MSANSLTRFLVAAGILVVASACSGGGEPTPPATSVASVSLTPTGNRRLFAVGETVQLTATPRDASGNPVSAQVNWTTSNASVVTVSSTGLVTATGFGTATVRASAGGKFVETSVLVEAMQTTTGFNVNASNACSNAQIREAVVKATSAHLIVMADVSNPANGFSDTDYQNFAATFESLIWPVVTENFGVPDDIDGNGRVIALFTGAVNQLSTSQSSVVGGFFFGRDLFPKVANADFQACPASNQAEMFYLLVPDPTGSLGFTRDVEFVRRITLGVIAHEFQHLINSSTRLFQTANADWPETVYMEEGLSHIAEELVFYESSGLLPRTNITATTLQIGAQTGQQYNAFTHYMLSNAGRFRNYLADPANNAPYQDDDDLATRGASWAFLRYLADRGVPGTPVQESACGSPVTLSVGGMCRVDGTLASSFSIAAGAGAQQEFTIVAFGADIPAVATGCTPPPGFSSCDTHNAGTMNVLASVTNGVPVAGPPNPSIGEYGAYLSTSGTASAGFGGPSVSLNQSFHNKLRAMERRELKHRVPAARAAHVLRNLPGARFYAADDNAPSFAVSVVEPVWKALVGATDTGMKNLQGRFGPDITGSARNWAVAHYTDDAEIPGFTSEVKYRHPSWHFRSVLPTVTTGGTYPLKVIHLTPTQSTQLYTNGGALYYRVGVAGGETSNVQFSVSAAPVGSISNLRLTIVRTK